MAQIRQNKTLFCVILISHINGGCGVNKIKSVSRVIRILLQIAMIALPIMLVFVWVYTPRGVALPGHISLTFIPKSIPIMHSLTVADKINGFFISLLPVGVTMMILYWMIQLFLLYEQGSIFSLDNVKCFKLCAITLLVWQLLLQLIYQALLTGVLTWHNPPGEGVIRITLGGTDIILVLVAVIILLISWVMAEGVKVYEEQQRIV